MGTTPDADGGSPLRGSGQRLRVCMVAYSDIASDPRILAEAEVLHTAGWEVDAIGIRPREGSRAPRWLALHTVPMETRRGGKARYIFQYSLFLLLSFARLYALHLSRRFTVVHVHSLPDFQVMCSLPLRLVGVHVVLDLHESMPEILAARFGLGSNSFWVRAAIAIEKLSCMAPHRILVSNPAIAQLLFARGVDPGRVGLVYNIGPGTRVTEPETVREKYGLRATTILVHAGGLNPERDVETLIRATAILSRASPVHLAVAGSGEARYVERLKQVARDLGVHERVEFLGQVPLEDALALMAISKVGVVTLQANPITEIGLPNRVLEFGRLGKALVLPNLPLLRRLFQGSAYFYTPGNPLDLADRIREAWADTADARQRASRAEAIVTLFSGPKMAEHLMSLYAGLGG